jgi:hypothetical protein
MYLLLRITSYSFIGLDRPLVLQEVVPPSQTFGTAVSTFVSPSLNSFLLHDESTPGLQ